MPDEDQMIVAIYAADRADGSAILGASMNLMAVVAAYGGIVVVALGADAFKGDRGAWIQAVIGTPLWGLICYHYVLLCLVLVRTNSIKILERTMLGPNTRLEATEKNQIGSDAGYWISNIQTQPHVLKPGSLAAYSSISLAVVAVNVWSVGLLIADEHHHGQALLGVIVHAVFFLCFLSVLVSYAIGGSWLLGKVAKRTGAYTVAPADSGMGNDPRHAAGTGADGISKP